MRITGLPPVAARAKAARGDDVPFASGTPDVRAAATPGAARPPTSLAMFVALAAGDEERERRRKLAEPAAAGLAALEVLEKGGPDDVEALADWLRELPAVNDPGLAAIQRDIALRVEVELAKRGR